MTGRYFIRNLDTELHRIALEAAAVAATNEVVGFEVSAIAPAPTKHMLLQAAADNGTSASPWPLLTLQSTPSPWTLWDGVVRSEVVGFALSSAATRDKVSQNRSGDEGNEANSFLARGVGRWAEAVFAEQDEAVGRPMERVLFEGARLLNGSKYCANSAGAACQPVQQFRALEVDPAHNAENNVVLRL